MGNGVAPIAPARIRQPSENLRAMTGNEAIARGAWEAGVRVAAAYPGTPSTEILENLAEYDPDEVRAQWSTNEKVALDIAIGASFTGVRALAAMKQVGLNVAADSFMSFTYIGAHGGLVMTVCDDPGIHSSQNEQDSRIYGMFGSVPVLEPSDAQEALDFTRLAFDLSEKFETPVIVRSTTRLSHTRSVVRTGERVSAAHKGFVDDVPRNVMIPSNARRQHPRLFEREARLREYFETSPLVRWDKGSSRVGIVSLSVPYLYVKEVAPDVPVLKLGVSNPLPEKTIREFAGCVDRVIVVEELEPVVEHELRAMGIAVEGKALFPRVGELSPDLVREGLIKAGVIEPTKHQPIAEIQPMVRPPVLCSGCPHAATYLALRDIGARVAGDIGCYTLAAVEPLKSIDTTVCMGASIGNAVGMALAGVETRPIFATIGDSTFLHSGIPPLIDAVYNNANITVVILDNHITAMTGGQDHPGTGKSLRGEPTFKVDYETICRAAGVEWIRTVDPYDLGTLHQALRESIAHKGVSVVICSRPCVLDPVKIKGAPLEVKDGCVACQSCMNLGCPSITWSDEMYEGRHKVRIDATCIGCSLCAQLCLSNCIRPVAS